MSNSAPSAARVWAEHQQETGADRRCPGIIALQPMVQHFAWGDPHFIPALLGNSNPDEKPCAELWMGAHPDPPSGAALGTEVVPLDQLLEAAAEDLLPPAVVAKF